MLFRDFKRFELHLILISSVFSVNSMYLSAYASNTRSVAHYMDDKGVKVENQTVKATLIDSGNENETETADCALYVDATENVVEKYKATRSDYRSNDDKDSRSDYDQEKIALTNFSSKFMLDIFMALHSAWHTAEQHRKEWSKNSTMNHDPIPDNETQMEDHRKLKRNSKLAKNETSSAKSFQESSRSANETSVSDGRYIKGDPVKGYYDFIITEGSFKFWATFQFTIACLVLYSTLSTLYYAKVNPVGAEYDYVEHFGGGRSFSDASLDYEDPTNDLEKNAETKELAIEEVNATSLWSSVKDWIPRTIQWTRTIFDTIDQIFYVIKLRFFRPIRRKLLSVVTLKRNKL